MEMVVEAPNTKSSVIEMKKFVLVKNINVYHKFINWVVGEFDLYLKNESQELKVHYPNGWFSIRCFNSPNIDLKVEINLIGKSKIACDILMQRILGIHEQVVRTYN